MRRALLAALAFCLALPLAAFGQTENEGPAGDFSLRAWALRYDYVNRESAAELEAYHRMTVSFETASLLLNPRAGVELRFRDSQVRTYWLGNDFQVGRRSTLHLRWNHTEYEDWQTSINYLNTYISYRIWWVRLAVGVGYAALNFEPEHFQNPLDFHTLTPETRFIYEVALHPIVWDRRLEFDIGMKNYNDFEYNGFDDTGFHGQAVWNITPNTTVAAMYERRYSALFISLPTLTRITWVFTVEQRF